MSQHLANDARNVNVGGGVIGGYFYSAPAGTPLPKTVWDDLDPAYVNLGYISEDGITITAERDSESIPDLNGTPIVSTRGARTETATVTFAEANARSWAEMFGYANVTDADGMIRAKENNEEQEERVYVFRLALRNGRRGYHIIPRGQCYLSGDFPINSTNLFGGECTVTYYSDDEGNQAYWLLESTDTTRPSHVEAPKWPEPYLGKTPEEFGTFTYGSDTISGVAVKVTGFDAFSKDPEMRTGYYLPFSVPDPKGAKITGKQTTTVTDDDPAMIWFLGKDKPELATLKVEGADGRIQRYDLSGIVAEED